MVHLTELAIGGTAVGTVEPLYKLNPVLTHSLKTPGFNP
jgi:fumarate hydratase class II